MFEKDVVLTLPLDKVEPDPGQPRQNFSKPELRELGASILHEGQRTPVECRPHPYIDDAVMLVHGERRYQAHRITEGLNTINVIVCSRFDNMTAEELFLDQIVDNAMRKNLDPMEDIASIEKAMKMGCTVEQIAKSLGKSEATVKADLPLMRLPENIRRALDRGDISKAVAREIATFEPIRMDGVFGEVKKVHGSAAQLVRIEAYRMKKSQTIADVFAQAADENSKLVAKEVRSLRRDLLNLRTAVGKFNVSSSGNGKGANMILACRNKPGLDAVENTAQTMKQIAEKILENCVLYRHTTTNPEHKAV